MRILKQMQMFTGLALLAIAGAALADPPNTAATPVASETVVVVGTAEDAWNCKEATPERARSLAGQALQAGAYQRAGECYLAAGEPGLADRAFAKASAQTSAETAHTLAVNLEEVKAQARQLKQAFLRR